MYVFQFMWLGYRRSENVKDLEQCITIAVASVDEDKTGLSY
jgi:hypothetical protein